MTAFGSHSEYGKLREVIVGIPDDLTLPPFSKELSHYNDELRAVLDDTGNQPLSIKKHFPERWERTRAQMEGIAKTFEDNDIIVHRVRPYSDDEKVYLDHLQQGHSLLYSADPVFVIGNHYLEINIRRAYRRKEVFPIREIVQPMIEADPDAHYVAMPPAQPWTPSGEGPGPFLEGGDILIQGMDIIVGMGNLCSNQNGINWLTRYIEPYGYTVHPMPIKGDILHTLGVICLLREGLCMAYLPALENGLPDPIKDWDVIELTHSEMEAHATVGVSLDDARYMINPRHNRVMDELYKHGIEPISTPCDDIGFWGGAIRCITLPLKRDPA
jgi:N-dimethylarginine dimethylaminohydrolase